MRGFITALLALSVVMPTLAQTPSGPTEIDKARLLAEVAAQKIEGDTRAALREAMTLEKSDRNKAIESLNATLASLQSDTVLPAAKRSTLIRVVRDRIRVIELGPDSPEAIAQLKQSEAAKRAADDAAAMRQSEEKKAVHAGLEAVAKLRKDGKHAQADAVVADLAGKYPDSVALQLLTGRTGFEKASKSAEKDRKDQDPKFLAMLRDVDNAGVPTDENVSFPKDFKERTKNRRDDAGPTKEERSMLKSLETVIDAKYKNSRFQDVIDHIATSMNRTIITDAGALTEAGITYDSPINFVAREPIATRTALRSVLSSVNLTYVVRDNIIHITTPNKAKDLMTTKVYYLGDLIIGAGPYGGTPTLGIANDQIQTVNNISALVEMITGAIDPQSWEKRGGQGHLGVNLPTMSLTVRQSQEVHTMIRSALFGTKK